MTEPVEASAAEAAARIRDFLLDVEADSVPGAPYRAIVLRLDDTALGFRTLDAADLRALLAEREQLRKDTELLRTKLDLVAGFGKVADHAAVRVAQKLTARAEQAETELDQARDELAEIRADVNEQWGVKWADRHRVAEYESEDSARRDYAAAIDPNNYNLPASRLLHRLVGEWRDAEPEDGERG